MQHQDERKVGSKKATNIQELMAQLEVMNEIERRKFIKDFYPVNEFTADMLRPVDADKKFMNLLEVSNKERKNILMQYLLYDVDRQHLIESLSRVDRLDSSQRSRQTALDVRHMGFDVFSSMNPRPSSNEINIASPIIPFDAISVLQKKLKEEHPVQNATESVVKDIPQPVEQNYSEKALREAGEKIGASLFQFFNGGQLVLQLKDAKKENPAKVDANSDHSDLHQALLNAMIERRSHIADSDEEDQCNNQFF